MTIGKIILRVVALGSLIFHSYVIYFGIIKNENLFIILGITYLLFDIFVYIVVSLGVGPVRVKKCKKKFKCPYGHKWGTAEFHSECTDCPSELWHSCIRVML